MNKRRWIVAAVMAAALAAATSPFWFPMTQNLDKPTVTRTEIMLDTAVTVTLSAQSGDGEKYLDGAFALLAELEQNLSRTKDGDLSRLDSSGTAEVGADADALLTRALELSGETGGAFDPALGNVIDLWDFKTDSPSLPDQTELSDALAKSGADKLARTGERVWTLSDGAKADLGAVAKGYIADRLTEYLGGCGVYWASVNLGGNTATVGYKPDKTTWSVGIRNPDAGENTLSASVEGEINTAVTSGDYERYFELGGVRYHHILDPATGYPSASGVSSVTVIGIGNASSADADAFSTALFVMGAEKGAEFIETRPDFEAVFISTNGEITYTSGVSPDGDKRVKLTIYK